MPSVGYEKEVDICIPLKELKRALTLINEGKDNFNFYTTVNVREQKKNDLLTDSDDSKTRDWIDYILSITGRTETELWTYIHRCAIVENTEEDDALWEEVPSGNRIWKALKDFNWAHDALPPPEKELRYYRDMVTAGLHLLELDVENDGTFYQIGDVYAFTNDVDRERFTFIVASGSTFNDYGD